MNHFRELRRDGDCCCRSTRTILAVAHAVAGLASHGVFIHCEHGMATVERVQDMCRTARAAGVQSIVRPEPGPFG